MFKLLPVLVIILAAVLSGCDGKELVSKPENLIPEEKYVKVITELQLLDSWVYTSEEISNPDSIMLEIFTFYGVTNEQFEQSHAYYQSKPQEHSARIDSALKILEKEQEKLNQSSED